MSEPAHWILMGKGFHCVRCQALFTEENKPFEDPETGTVVCFGCRSHRYNVDGISNKEAEPMDPIKSVDERHGGLSLEILERKFTLLGQAWRANILKGSYPVLEKRLKTLRAAWNSNRTPPVTEIELEVVKASARLLSEGCESDKGFDEIAGLCVRDFAAAVSLFLAGARNPPADVPDSASTLSSE